MASNNSNSHKKKTQHQFENILLHDRYQIGKSIDQGAFAQIFQIMDLKNPQSQLVIKIQEYSSLIKKEIKILKLIRNQNETEEKQIALPMVIDYGTITLKNKSEANSMEEEKQNLYDATNDVEIASKVYAFYIMPQFQFSLHSFYQTDGKVYVQAKEYELLSVQNTLEIAIQCIDALQTLHSTGYVHNDIKPDNIMFNPQLNGSQVLLRNIKLIDFGFASKYIDSKTKLHINNKILNEFQGNLEFSSLNQMNFERPSRRDDMISLCQLLLTTLNNFYFPCQEMSDVQKIYDDDGMNDRQRFKKLQSIKDSTTILNMVEILKKSKFIIDKFGQQDEENKQEDTQKTKFFTHLTNFAKSIQYTSFESEPEYGYLKTQLVVCQKAYQSYLTRQKRQVSILCPAKNEFVMNEKLFKTYKTGEEKKEQISKESMIVKWNSF